MGRRHTAKREKLNNTGSAIVTVLVVVAFMTILATIMLYVSGLNFQMKVVDYRTKESFYYAETPLEEIRAQLVEDVQVAFSRAYAETISEYASWGGNAEDHYRQLFFKEMDVIWKSRCGTDADGNIEWENGIRNIVQISIVPGDIWEVKVSKTKGFEDGKETDADGNVVANGWLILRGVEFTYDSPEGYTSIISTDFCITIPKVQWPVRDEASGIYKYPEAANDLNFSDCVNYMNWTKK